MSRPRKKKRFNFFHFIILALLIYIVVVFGRQEKLLNELEAKKENNLMEIENLQKDILKLEDEIESSDSLSFVEKVARDELGMVKPREIIYIDKNKKKSSIFSTKNRDK